jgi:1,2-diacylglycerol 3-beta-galactosyltransferase
MGLSDDQIVQHGLPIRPAFSKPHASRTSLRRRLNMHASLPVVLMVGGGEGMGKLEDTVLAIAARGVRCQVAVVCGRNEALRRRLAAGSFGVTQVVPFGFVSNMDEFMAASDAIITKAGTMYIWMFQWIISGAVC